MRQLRPLWQRSLLAGPRLAQYRFLSLLLFQPRLLKRGTKIRKRMCVLLFFLLPLAHAPLAVIRAVPDDVLGNSGLHMLQHALGREFLSALGQTLLTQGLVGARLLDPDAHLFRLQGFSQQVLQRTDAVPLRIRTLIFDHAIDDGVAQQLFQFVVVELLPLSFQNIAFFR